MTDNGVVLVFAAGNIRSTQSLCHQVYANIPGVINVSGVDVNNNHEPTKTVYNSWVDVCALSMWVPFLYSRHG